MSETKLTVGFKETKEVLALAIALGKGVEASLADDGKITIRDIPNFFPTLFKLKDAFEGIEQVPVEFKLATPEEAAELKAFVKAELDLEDDKIEKFIEDSFMVVLDIWMLVKDYFLKPTVDPISDEQADQSPA
jgi:hypothetical protein